MTKTNGYDSELFEVEKDLLDRERLAKSIFRTISDTPNDWPVRVGIFGEWGMGKTTLLNYLNKQAKEHDYPVIKLDVGTFSTPNELWSAFFIKLLTELEKHRIDISNALTWGWMPKFIADILPTSWILKIYSISRYVNKNIQHDIANSALNFLSGNLQFGSQFFESLKEQLNGKKIIFEIDDFDRLPPDLVPQFLIALREILNLPCFAFVLSMDRNKVANAIRVRHPNYDTGHPFLEKIIDFPYPLPDPTREQIESIFLDQLHNIVGFSSSQIDYASMLPYLPMNPRKLKFVARNIKIFKDELLRHGEDEIKWKIIIFLCLLRSKSQHAYDIVTKKLTTDDLYKIMFIDDEAKRQEKIDQEINSLIKYCNDLPEQDEELLSLLKYFFNNYYEFQASNLHYFANLINSPHFLTWKEFKQLLAEYKNNPSTEVITNWIKKILQHRGNKHYCSVVSELFESATNHYSNCLANAADTDLLEEFETNILDAHDSLQFIEALFFAIEKYNTKEFFQLLDRIISWQHFQKNEKDLTLREQELKVAITLIDKLTRLNTIEIFHGLAIRKENLSYFTFGEEADKPKSNFIDKIINSFNRDPLSNLQCEFEKENEVKRIKVNGNTALGYILLNKDSILFKGNNIDKLDAILSQASTNLIIYKNLKDYFGIFCEYAGQKILTDEILKLTAARLWKSITSRQLQFRSHSGLLKQRNLLISAGITPL